MANFETHVLGAVTVGVVATALLSAAQLLPLTAVPAGIGLVALGGVAPDVDSDHSDALSLVFATMGVGLAAPVLVAALPAVGLLAGLAVMAAVYGVVRYVVPVPFRWLTVHRGRCHSVPAGLLAAAGLTFVCHQGLLLDPVQSWLLGALFGMGFATHLVLDELYSVDLGIKRSFGSALKLGARRDWLGYLGLYAALALVLLAAPSPRDLVVALASVRIGLLPPPELLALLP
ncbi:MAG: metal-dependent hydrolase [Myxococcota bacterium]